MHFFVDSVCVVLYERQFLAKKCVAGDNEYSKHAMELLILVNMLRGIVIILMKDQDNRERERRRGNDKSMYCC